MAFRVDTVFVWVTDMAVSLDWYGRFGIEAGPRYGTWQTMEVDGVVTFALHQGDRAEGPSTGAVAFRVTDLDSEIAARAAQGIEPVDAEITDTGVSRFITFRDPDGNDVQMLER